MYAVKAKNSSSSSTKRPKVGSKVNSNWGYFLVAFVIIFLFFSLFPFASSSSYPTGAYSLSNGSNEPPKRTEPNRNERKDQGEGPRKKGS